MDVCKYACTQNGEEIYQQKANNKLVFHKELNQLPVIDTLQDLIHHLTVVFQDDNVNIDYVQYLMKSYKTNPADWKKYAKFDRYRYTRNLVDKGNGKFNLLALCWGEGHCSAIHDHANAHCFMKVLQGSLQEVRFAWPEESKQSLKEISKTKLHSNEVCYINDSLGLHRVENPSHTEPAVSLHLYSPPFDMCSVFNQQTGQRSVCKVTFWSQFGEKRNKEAQENRAPDDN